MVHVGHEFSVLTRTYIVLKLGIGRNHLVERVINHGNVSCKLFHQLFIIDRNLAWTVFIIYSRLPQTVVIAFGDAFVGRAR